MDSRSPLAKSLISNGLNSQFAVNLINYLNRLINGYNLYDVYINNINEIDKTSDIRDYITHENQAVINQQNINI